jgi:hypothetical protein
MSAGGSLAKHSIIAALALVVASGGCGSDAVGVGDCRDIEFARCDAGRACGSVSDTAACKRFYRDHCLHGLALESEPGAQAVRRCVGSLKAVAACGSGIALAACPGVTNDPSTTRLQNACDVVNAPEEIQECAFLIAEPSQPPPDAGNPPPDATSSDSGADAATE